MNSIFLCQITESSLKLIKCLIHSNFRREFVGVEVEVVPADIDDKKLSERLSRVFKKLEYNNNPIVITLARSKVTSRHLTVPTQIPKEIENIISLQASRYLPYPANELITAYQILSTNKEGYSDINLVIVHKDVIERYINIFKEIKTTKLTIALSSFGLCNLYSYIEPGEPGPVMVIDIDSEQIEVAITRRKKLLFSRYFKLNHSLPNWENLFIEEIRKTQDAYSKEVSQELPHKIVFLGAGKTPALLKETINKQIGIPVESLSYREKVNLPPNLSSLILNADTSFVSIIGLGIEDVAGSLNFLPQEIKEQIRKLSQRKEYLRIALFISIVILVFGLGTAKNLENKTKYLARLKSELNKVAGEARSLEEIEKRFRILEGQIIQKPSSLDIIYELHQNIPSQVSLVNFVYEENSQVILRGQAPELNFVFELVANLEKSLAFKNFNIKVRYATKRVTQLGEIVDFEITCAKK